MRNPISTAKPDVHLGAPRRNLNPGSFFTHWDDDPAGIRIGRRGDLTLGAGPRECARNLPRLMGITSAAVYVLLGTKNGRDCAREGEAVDVDQRLSAHLNDRELSWFDTIAIFTCDDMKKPDAQAVECLIARQIQHSAPFVDHASVGPIMHTVDRQVWRRAHEFLLAIRSLAPLIGINVFDPRGGNGVSSHKNSVLGFHKQWPNGHLKPVLSSECGPQRPTKSLDLADFVCVAQERGGEWTLLAGSQIKKVAQPSSRKWHSALRSDLINAGTLCEVAGYPDRLELTKDLPIGTMPSVTQFVMGNTQSDCRRWQDVPLKHDQHANHFPRPSDKSPSFSLLDDPEPQFFI